MEDMTALLRNEKREILDRRKELNREMRDLERAETRLDRVISEYEAVKGILNGEVRGPGRPAKERSRLDRWQAGDKKGMTGSTASKSRRVILDLFAQGQLNPESFSLTEVGRKGPFRSAPQERIAELIDRGFMERTGRKIGPGHKAHELRLTKKGLRRAGLVKVEEPAVKDEPLSIRSRQGGGKHAITAPERITQLLQKNGPMYGPEITKAMLDEGYTRGNISSALTNMGERGQIVRTGNQRKAVAGPFMAVEYTLPVVEQRATVIEAGEGVRPGRLFARR